MTTKSHKAKAPTKAGSPDRVTVEFFSWLTGLPNGRQTFDQADISAWRFYDSKAAWQHAGDKVFA